MSTATLIYMAATPKDAARERAKAALRRVVEEDFGGNGTKAAEALGFSQPHLSNMLSQANRGPGIEVLLKLREYTGRSVDELLGYEETPRRDFAAERFELKIMRETIMEILEMLRDRGTGDRQKRAEIRANAEKLRKGLELLGGQIARDERVEEERRKAAG